MPPSFITTIKSIIHKSPPPPASTPFIFSMTKEAAIHNEKILSQYNYDLTRIISGHPHSNISYGSEFRTSAVLQPLLHRSPLWPTVSSILDEGAKYPLDCLSNVAYKTFQKQFREATTNLQSLNQKYFANSSVKMSKQDSSFLQLSNQCIKSHTLA